MYCIQLAVTLLYNYIIYNIHSLQMTGIEHQYTLVKESFFEFLNTHIPGADLSVVDEIVLSYVTSILKEASNDPCFDIDGTVDIILH